MKKKTTRDIAGDAIALMLALATTFGLMLLQHKALKYLKGLNN